MCLIWFALVAWFQFCYSNGKTTGSKNFGPKTNTTVCVCACVSESECSLPQTFNRHVPQSINAKNSPGQKSEAEMLFVWMCVCVCVESDSVVCKMNVKLNDNDVLWKCEHVAKVSTSLSMIRWHCRRRQLGLENVKLAFRKLSWTTNRVRWNCEIEIDGQNGGSVNHISRNQLILCLPPPHATHKLASSKMCKSRRNVKLLNVKCFLPIRIPTRTA